MKNEKKWNFRVWKDGEPGGSGDIAKNFKNEGMDADWEPEYFSRQDEEVLGGGLRDEPRFFAREFIQNSMDASESKVFTDAYGNGVGPLKISFTFSEVSGKNKRKLIDALDLTSLKTRREFLADRAHVKQTENCLDELEKDEVPLKILRAVEHGASGMEGPWGQSGSVSKMTVALLSNNMADKPLMAGGGYGQGKSVLPLISRIRTVLAYTCFPAGKICDLGMSIPSSRRLLGIAYWPEHTFEGEKTTGYGWLHAGENTDEENSALPWVDDAADLMAGSLGIEPRLPDTAEDSGTTFMI